MRRVELLVAVEQELGGDVEESQLAGIYTVRFVSKSRIERLTPTTVTVRSGAVLRRNFTIDTGIR